MSGIFVTGTDTDVGKTWVTTHLLKRLRETGLNAAGMKPIECGSREDAEAILKASGNTTLTLNQINPVSIPEPLAPVASTMTEAISFDQIQSAYKTLQSTSDFVIVEGAGGWLVPVDTERTMADLVKCLKLPVLIVAANRIGVLNHTLLTVQSIELMGLTCAGVFLNTINPDIDASQSSNAVILRKVLTKIPVFDGDIPELAASIV
mgnify:FL=1|tara:strand:+ start:335 stop:952 length:618 start_codon:yes stop_codon:yes gene_type:complete